MSRNPSEITLTTSYQLAGKEIAAEVDIITAECVYGMNIFRDIMAGVRDFFGGRAQSVEKVLQDAKDEVFQSLREQASGLGADAVIAIDLDYHELSGGGKAGMLLVVATGTAVRTR